MNPKIMFIQLISILTVIVINSALVVSYLNYGIIPNLENFKNLSINIIDVSILLFSIYIFISNTKIPFMDYDIIMDQNDLDHVDDAIKIEMNYITTHIVTSFILVLITISFIYFYNL